ncbi:TPA: major capsid protein [Photobacterium damselae]
MSKFVTTIKTALSNKTAQITTVAVAGVSSSSAFAALDVTGAAGAITGGGDQIVSVQTAILGLAAIALVGRWVKATFF